MPIMAQNNSKVVEKEIQLEFVMGPGVSLTGEVMWDQTQVNAGTGTDRKRVTFGFVLSENKNVSHLDSVKEKEDEEQAASYDQLEQMRHSMQQLDAAKTGQNKRLNEL